MLTSIWETSLAVNESLIASTVAWGWWTTFAVTAVFFVPNNMLSKLIATHSQGDITPVRPHFHAWVVISKGMWHIVIILQLADFIERITCVCWCVAYVRSSYRCWWIWHAIGHSDQEDMIRSHTHRKRNLAVCGLWKVTASWLYLHCMKHEEIKILQNYWREMSSLYCKLCSAIIRLYNWINKKHW